MKTVVFLIFAAVYLFVYFKLLGLLVNTFDIYSPTSNVLSIFITLIVIIPLSLISSKETIKFVKKT
ncbi:hypothetical protein ACQKP0_02900 [Heyndrickxia sp. NPDC080065]|uniref:hypothetical protein n=1 Tax=Heyndrickxia sp. NPDC080065 TaxID=3390568 RepID=UPI003D094FFF